MPANTATRASPRFLKRSPSFEGFIPNKMSCNSEDPQLVVDISSDSGDEHTTPLNTTPMEAPTVEPLLPVSPGSVMTVPADKLGTTCHVACCA